MDILYLLIPLSALLVLGLIAVFGWALNSGQFDDLQREGYRPFEAREGLEASGAPGVSGASAPFELPDALETGTPRLIEIKARNTEAFENSPVRQE